MTMLAAYYYISFNSAPYFSLTAIGRSGKSGLLLAGRKSTQRDRETVVAWPAWPSGIALEFASRLDERRLQVAACSLRVLSCSSLARLRAAAKERRFVTTTTSGCRLLQVASERLVASCLLVRASPVDNKVRAQLP